MQGDFDEPDMKCFIEATYEAYHMARLEHLVHLGRLGSDLEHVNTFARTGNTWLGTLGHLSTRFGRLESLGSLGTLGALGGSFAGDTSFTRSGHLGHFPGLRHLKLVPHGSLGAEESA